MSIKARLQEELKAALRDRDEVRKAALRFTLAAIKNSEIEQRGELDEAHVMAVLQREVKRRQETIAELKEAGRAEALARETAELECLLPYLPRSLSREEIAQAARAAIAELGATSPAQFGQVMKRLMADLKGQADGRLVGEVVKELLGA